MSPKHIYRDLRFVTLFKQNLSPFPQSSFWCLILQVTKIELHKWNYFNKTLPSFSPPTWREKNPNQQSLSKYPNDIQNWHSERKQGTWFVTQGWWLFHQFSKNKRSRWQEEGDREKIASQLKDKKSELEFCWERSGKIVRKRITVWL